MLKEKCIIVAIQAKAISQARRWSIDFSQDDGSSAHSRAHYLYRQHNDIAFFHIQVAVLKESLDYYLWLENNDEEMDQKKTVIGALCIHIGLHLIQMLQYFSIIYSFTR